MVIESYSFSKRTESESEPPPTDVVEKFPDKDELVEVSPEQEQQFFETMIGHRLDQEKNDEKRRQLVKILPTRIQSIFKHRNPEAWSQFVDEWKKIDGASPSAAKEMAISAYDLRKGTFESLAHYEHELRRHLIVRNGVAPLTPDLAINYGLYKNEAHVHFGPSRTIKHRRRQMESGMQKLAELLKTHEELQQIEKITARSWIVEEHPKLFTLHGFTLIEEENKKKPELAEISREDFFAQFGDNTSTS